MQSPPYDGLVAYLPWARERGISRSTAYYRARHGLVPGLIKVAHRYHLPKQVAHALDTGDVLLLSVMQGATADA